VIGRVIGMHGAGQPFAILGVCTAAALAVMVVTVLIPATRKAPSGVGDRGADRRAGLSHKYLGEGPPPEPADALRLVVRVRPQKVNKFSV
jgi:hypothetical protein